MSYRRVIATSSDFSFAALVTLYANGDVCGRTFGHHCGCAEHNETCEERLEDELAMLNRRLPHVEILRDAAAREVLSRFGRSRPRV